MRFSGEPTLVTSSSPLPPSSPSSKASHPSSPGLTPQSPLSPRHGRSLSFNSTLELDGLTLAPPVRRQSRPQSVCLTEEAVKAFNDSGAEQEADRSRSDSIISVSAASDISAADTAGAGSHSALLSLPHRSVSPAPSSSSSENIRVIIRCRPILPHERMRSAGFLNFSPDGRSLTLAYRNKTKTFSFDSVFPCSVSQAELYRDVASELIEQALQGYNATVFAYGQTGSGKSHTMMGDIGSEEEAGVIPRAIAHIFSHIEQTAEEEERSQSPLSIKYSISLSFLQIYNEKASDLLAGAQHVDLEVREQDGTFFAPQLTRWEVKGKDELLELIRKGDAQRYTAATNQNSRSSRSHTILTLHIDKRVGKKRAAGEAQSDDEGAAALLISSKLNLVDLAGSERLSTSTKVRQGRETLSINLSLSCLSNCILCLTEGSIPTYRDSKLTRLLKDSLGGNSKTTMVACVSSCESNGSESVSTLRWAERAKRVRNQPVVNDGDKHDAKLRKLREEMQELKQRMLGRNKDMIRMLWMVKQLSHGNDAAQLLQDEDGRGGQQEEKQGEQQSPLDHLALTEAILQDPFNHPMTSVIAREQELDGEPLSPFQQGRARLGKQQEEKERDDEDGDEANNSFPAFTPTFLEPSDGSSSPTMERRRLAAAAAAAAASRRPSSAPGGLRPRASTSTMNSGVFRLIRDAMLLVNQQIKSQVEEVPAFDEDSRSRSGSQQEQSAAADRAVTASLSSAEAEWQQRYEELKQRSDEDRQYQDAVLADLSRQLQEEQERKLTLLMQCRCREYEGRLEELAARLEEEQRGRTLAQEEKQQVWAALEEAERERAEERKAMDALKAELATLRHRDSKRETERQEQEHEAEQRRHQQVESDTKLQRLEEEVMHLETEKRVTEEKAAEMEAEVSSLKEQLSAVRATQGEREEAESSSRLQAAEAETELERLRATAADWQQRCEAETAAAEREHRQRSESEQQIRTLEQETQQLRTEMEQLSASAAAAEQRAVALTAEGRTLREQLSSSASASQAHVDAKQAELAAVKKDSAAVQATIEQERAELSLLRQEKLQAEEAAREQARSIQQLELRLQEAEEERQRERSHSEQSGRQLVQVRQVLLQLHRWRLTVEQSLSVSVSVSVSGARSSSSSPSSRRTPHGQTMQALSETMTHAQVRSMLRSPASPAAHSTAMTAEAATNCTASDQPDSSSDVQREQPTEEDSVTVEQLLESVSVLQRRLQSEQQTASRVEAASRQRADSEVQRVTAEKARLQTELDGSKADIARLQAVSEAQEQERRQAAQQQTLADDSRQQLQQAQADLLLHRQSFDVMMARHEEQQLAMSEQLQLLRDRCSSLSDELQKRSQDEQSRQQEHAAELAAVREAAEERRLRLEAMQALSEELEQAKAKAETAAFSVSQRLQEREVAMEEMKAEEDAFLTQVHEEVAKAQRLRDEDDARKAEQLLLVMQDKEEETRLLALGLEEETSSRTGLQREVQELQQRVQALQLQLAEAHTAHDSDAEAKVPEAASEAAAERRDMLAMLAGAAHKRRAPLRSLSMPASMFPPFFSLTLAALSQLPPTAPTQPLLSRQQKGELEPPLSQVQLSSSSSSSSSSSHVSHSSVQKHFLSGSASSPSLPPHPLYEATAELRACFGLLRAEYEDACESKVRLARETSREVESMRDGLRHWRLEEWERALAKDKIRRMAKRRWRRDAAPEAVGVDGSQREEEKGKCSIM